MFFLKQTTTTDISQRSYGIFLCELITRGAINLVRRKETAFGLDVKALEEHIPKDCPPLFWKVAFCCCTYNPQRRPSMLQVSTKYCLLSFFSLRSFCFAG